MILSHDPNRRSPGAGYVLPLLALALALPLLTPGSALAAGFEYGQPGARAEGRGGAEVAGADSPNALYFNPANLARIDRVRLQLVGSIMMINNCIDREIAELSAGQPYEPDAEAAAATPDASGRYFVPEVCNDSRPVLVPQLLLTVPILDGLTLGAGLLIPVGPQVGDYGGEDGLLGDSGIPAGPRYLTSKQDIIQVFPTIGLGYAFNDMLRIGAAFGAGITRIEFSNFAFSDLLATFPGVTPDVRNSLHVMDWFSPRVTGGIAATPMPGLDLSFAFTWTGDVVGDGHLDIDLPADSPLQPETPPIEDTILETQQNWNLAFGARYAQRLAQPVGHVGDRMATERWDIEANFLVFGNERVNDFIVDLPDDAMLGGLLPLPDEIALPHRWKNQYVVRLGGDFNAIPGVLAVRAGLSYETDGVKDGWEQIDFQPFQRFGIHLGGTFRIADKIDISVAYAHLFQEDIDNLGSYCLSSPDLVNQPVCQPRTTSAAMPTAGDVSVANAGRIDSSMNILVVEGTVTFGGPRHAEPTPPPPEWEQGEVETDVEAETEIVPVPGEEPRVEPTDDPNLETY